MGESGDNRGFYLENSKDATRGHYRNSVWEKRAAPEDAKLEQRSKTGSPQLRSSPAFLKASAGRWSCPCLVFRARPYTLPVAQQP